MNNWKLVYGFEDHYRVSDQGEVSSIKTGKTLKPAKVGAGYLRVCLFVDGKGHNKYIHRIVAETFFGKEPDKEVNHRNGNKEDNRIQNLEWVNRSENMVHYFYETSKKVKPMFAIKTDLSEVLEFASIEKAVQAGFSSPRIYDCLRGDRESHGGWYFVLKTHPQPKREWVGLTDEEIQDSSWHHFVTNQWPTVHMVVRKLEAKLKEKNT